MSRLVANAGTPQAWEILLRPGTNSLGRGPANDFQLNDPSVSGNHCEITLTHDQVTLKDLGSTNGTFIGGSRIQEAVLQNGQSVRLGSLELTYLADAPDTVPAGAPSRAGISEVAPLAAPTLAPAGSGSATIVAPKKASVRLRISGAPVASTEVAEPPPIEPPIVPEAPTGPRFCKFHPRSPARFLCHKCNRTFCELCVSSRMSRGQPVKTCRSCGVECVPLEVTHSQSRQRGFFATLPGAFIYPFRGMGVIILVLAAIAFSALSFLSHGIFSIFIRGAFYGFVFLFMQNIIHTTTSDANESLSFPSPDGLGGAALELLGTIVVSFGIAIGLIIARVSGVDIPVGAIIGAVLLGCFYFPMAFLAVAMKDTVVAANPLVVFPAIMNTFGHYVVAVLLLVCVFGARQLGTILSGVAGSVTFRTHDTSVLAVSLSVMAGCALLSVYLLTVTMRILGLFYNANRRRLGWF